MAQTHTESIIENVLNLGSGFVIALLVYEYFILANPAIRDDSLVVTMIFTTISLARGYIWRRIFNKLENKNE